MRAATTVQVPIERTDLQRLGDDPDIEGHGFLWWITTVDDHAGFAATGWGGQLLEVVPARRLVAPAINPS